MPKVDISEAVFSFSKLKTFETCPYSWYDIYVNKAERIQNAFSQYGTLAHSILERYAVGKKTGESKLLTWELVSLLNDEFKDAITESFPKNPYYDSDAMKQRYYDSALTFFSEVDDCEIVANIESERFEILGVEYEFNFPIKVEDKTYGYRGFIDLVVRDREDNGIIIIDHKSKSIKASAKGIPAEKDIRDAYLQMSSYATAIFLEFGQYPKEIWINAFKIQKIFKKKFDLKMAEEAVTWAGEIIKKLEVEKEFPKKPDSFFCLQLCSCRNVCGKFIMFDKTGALYGNQPQSMAEKIASDDALFGDLTVCDYVKPFSWDDDDEEFEL